jgi:hypothetical protein
MGLFVPSVCTELTDLGAPSRLSLLHVSPPRAHTDATAGVCLALNSVWPLFTDCLYVDQLTMRSAVRGSARVCDGREVRSCCVARRGASTKCRSATWTHVRTCRRTFSHARLDLDVDDRDACAVCRVESQPS